MSQIESIQPTTQQWTTICPLDRILPNTGVCALIDGQQVAVFRVGEGEDIYAIENYDPFSKAYVLSRGIVGDRNGIPKVASPIYKQNFSLLTGECLDDAKVKLQTFSARVVDEQVQVSS
ncbi:nitrite reductase small subunit NirD [Chamaesiphon minutus]|uniref:NAD(P)H-dependent nitrite reductase, small subunit n=1 Tax=Chamaesiphon minutus (strain ATCC 27169 / PCC 6605) TaxID=1173020 RepID=K9UQM2_CHAP6|nr:nitrite reductase small subunit NirD [Chamaesiphon minutus]AFY96539.1 NAD(P)H-dependent nitrite reductase, small subunit [Chamaesiphon minutus PCC 6605]